MKKILTIIIIIIVIAGLLYIFRQAILIKVFAPTEPQGSVGVNQETVNNQADEQQLPDLQVVVTDLDIPWEIAWLPNGEMLVTERSGNLLKIGSEKQVIKIAGVRHVGEGGLQGLALHPNFADNNWIYLYFTTESDDGLINRVERYELNNNELLNKLVIIDNLPGAANHDGGRMEFGPDDKLYITVGDAQASSRAQDLDYLGGKILRLNDDGSIPADNPFDNSPVYSLGHRNPQGLAWDDDGQLWATEHGRSGAQSGYDELNKIMAGKNYGWPIIQGDQTRTGMESPVINSGASSTWAPADAVYYQGRIFFTGLRGESLYEYNIAANKLTTHFYRDYGRLRALQVGPDNWFYVSTSNRDGRGTIRQDDDKIVKINPEVFRTPN